MTSRKSYIIAACLWLVMVLIFFWPVVFQNKVIAPLDIMDSLLRPWADAKEIQVHNAFTYDAVSQYLPYDWSVSQSLKQDGYIGWNPYTHSGSSIVENTMICPGDWRHHLYRIFPFWSAWNLGIILQFTLAGLGMLLLLRDQKIPATYALIGVVTFGFYSQFIVWINHRWVLGAMSWAPWILWSLFRAKKSARIIHLPSILFIALGFRGGHLQASVFVVILVLLVAAADWWRSEQRWNLRQIIKIFFPYAVSGVLGCVFALDVFMETVPALLNGVKQMPARGWTETMMALPTLASSILPASMGTPQGLDVMKFFRVTLFEIKFMSAVALLLAAFAASRREAPNTARVLLLIGLALPFTPADKWLYSRVTVIFAMGGAWLAAWNLMKISEQPPSKLWKRSMFILGIFGAVWLLGSAVILEKREFLQTKIHEIVLAKLPSDKPTRLDWMLSRADYFLNSLLIWTPRNLATLGLIGLGIFACSRIHNQNRNASRFAVLVAFCALGEIMLFASTWITFSGKPEGSGLYSEPAWASRLKQHVDNGTILCIDRSDFDYMQLNTPSAYGIRFAEGYETVVPHRIDPYNVGKYDPKRCAASGISHLLVQPEKDPGSIAGWEKIDDSKEFVLYKNSAFQSICTAETTRGDTLPLEPIFKTPNRREIALPANIKSVTLMESFNPGWKYSLEGDAWRPVAESALHGIRIDLKNPTSMKSSKLILEYRPVYQPFYRATMGIAAIGLLSFSIHRRVRRNHSKSLAPEAA